MFSWKVTFLLLVVVATTATSDLNELLKMDPELWPGHMEPFGAKQKTVEVETLDYWPDPKDFFKNYVEQNKPVAFKGLAKKSPAYQLFTDDFLESFPGADEVMVTAEPNKKEIRKSAPQTMSFKEFINRYHNESLYMVNALPEALRKYVLMPASLRCEETRDILASQVTWFSSGGTKSVVHNDDVDNINCLYRGSKELLFIDYNINKEFVPIDHPEGGYSSIDVDKVNYTAYPTLRHVDQYHHVTMEEGDCLFIPYHWFHQVNSFANSENGQNLAINTWFKHVFDHRPKDCQVEPMDATLDKFAFKEDEREQGGGEENEMTPWLDSIVGILKKKKKISTKLFTKIILKHPVLNPMKIKASNELPDAVVTSIKKMFTVFDVNADGVIESVDIEQLEADEQKLEARYEVMNIETAVIEDYFEDLVENENQERLRADVGGKDEL